MLYFRYLMVDVVVNNIPSLAIDTYKSPDALKADGAIWTKTEQYHSQCWIDYSNTTSVEYWYVKYCHV